MSQNISLKDMRANQKDPVIIVNGQGYVIYCNPTFLKVFGFTAQEAISQHITFIIPDDLKSAHNLGFSRFVGTGQSKILNQSLNLKVIDKNKNIYDATHYIIAEKVGSDWEIAATIIPVHKS